MTNLKNCINQELNHISLNITEEEIITKAKHKPATPRALYKLSAVALALVFLAGICFTPKLFGNKESGFVIMASAMELSNEEFIDIHSNAPNYVKFNFGYILDDNADATNITNRYLFHSFEKQLDLTIVGDNIRTITYSINNGSLTSTKVTEDENGNRYHYFKNSYSKHDTEFTIEYTDQNNWCFSINPICPKDDFFYDTTHYVALPETGDIVERTESTEKAPIAYGYISNATPLATEREIEALRNYAYKNDMIGFYNYQNKIFERIISEITLDITVTKTNGSTETKTLQLCYTPIEVISCEETSISHSNTLSNGTLSAKIISN